MHSIYEFSHTVIRIL